MADERRKKLAEADLLVRRGKFDKAVVIFRSLAEASPRDLSLRQRLADALARAGSGSEACKHFEQIAEAYWDAGHRSRAIATLKRAQRIRSGSPSLLFRLGAWIMEHGHPADAREVLLEGARLDFRADVAEDVYDTFELLSRHLPDDPAVHEALLVVAERTRREELVAGAGASLARSLARAGRGEEAAAALRAALAADAESLSALANLPHLVEVVDQAGPEPLLGEGDDGAPPAGAVLLVAAWHARHARPEEGAALLERHLAGGVDLGAPGLVYAAEVFVELERPDAACTLLERAESAGGGEDLATRRRMVRVLHAALAAAPGHEAATRLLEQLTAVSAATPRESAAGPASGPKAIALHEESALAEDDELTAVLGAEDAETGAAVGGGRELPPRVIQHVAEARSLLTHGLADAANRALSRIPSAYREHPEVASVLEAVHVGVAGAARAEVPKVPRAPRRKPAAPPPEGDDLVVVLDDDEDAYGARTAPASDLAAAAPAKPDESLGAVIAAEGVDDDETRYQMAVGLLQMGLNEQAVEMLESCLERPERRGEAALELVRLHTQSGDVARALETGVRAVEAPGLTLLLRGELLAEIAALACHEGRSELAREYVSELDAIAPDHPSLEGLRARVVASEN